MIASFNQVAFDQRVEQIGLSSPSGFAIFEAAKGVVLYEARLPRGGCDNLSLLVDSNLVAFSGDGSKDGIPKTSVILWDKNTHKPIRTLEHQSNVLKIVFNADVLLVVQENSITFYSTSDFSPYYKCSNPTHHHECVSIVQSLDHNLVSLPRSDGQSLLICDYHDPAFILGEISTPASEVNFAAFDRQGELLALALDGGRQLSLWSMANLRVIAVYKRGLRRTEVTGICFDNLSNYFLLTTKRGTLHLFGVPTPGETIRGPMTPSRSMLSYDAQRGIDFFCQFDNVGYVIIGITTEMRLKKLRVDVEQQKILTLSDDKIDM